MRRGTSSPFSSLYAPGPKGASFSWIGTPLFRPKLRPCLRGLNLKAQFFQICFPLYGQRGWVLQNHGPPHQINNSFFSSACICCIPCMRVCAYIRCRWSGFIVLYFDIAPAYRSRTHSCVAASRDALTIYYFRRRFCQSLMDLNAFKCIESSAYTFHTAKGSETWNRTISPTNCIGYCRLIWSGICTLAHPKRTHKINRRRILFNTDRST